MSFTFTDPDFLDPLNVEKPVIQQTKNFTAPKRLYNEEEIEQQKKELTVGNQIQYDEFAEEHGIDENITQNILCSPSLSWNYLSPIQEKTLPIILKEKCHLIVQSQSGTGKTGCFALGMIQSIDKENLGTPQVICLAPTLELAAQIDHVVREMVKDTILEHEISLEIKGSQSGLNVEKAIVIGTPGKIKDKISRGTLFVKNVKMLVLDEADLLLEDKEKSMREDVKEIRALITENSPNMRVLLFSATFETEDGIGQSELDELEKQKKVFDNFAAVLIPQNSEVRTFVIPREKQTLKMMVQSYIDAGSFFAKKDIVKDLLTQKIEGQTIIFTNKKDGADSLQSYLLEEGFEGIKVLHGDLPVEDRKRIIGEFKKGEFKILISTNVMSRGLDISSVTHVINYDIPVALVPGTGYVVDTATYLHRTGRTARFGKKGTAINIVGTLREVNFIADLEQYFNISIPKCEIEELGA